MVKRTKLSGGTMTFEAARAFMERMWEDSRIAARKRWAWVFDEAAEVVRAKIRGAAAYFPEDDGVADLLGFLDRHLFDETLDVTTWMIGSGCSRGTRDRFSSKMGPLKPYLDGHRIAVAAEVLWRTAAPIGEVGRRSGFKELRTFQRTFERRIGKSPGDFQASGPAEPEGTDYGAGRQDGSAPDTETRIRAAFWRRQVTLGLLDRARAEELRALLRRRYETLLMVLRRGAGLRRCELPALLGAEPQRRAQALRITDAVIELDVDRAPPELNPLFAAIRELRFEPKLTLEKVLQTAGLADSSSRRMFAAFTGQSMWSYVREARLETAALLLLWSSLSITEVCRRVGYTSLTTFYRTFFELTGLRITEFREHARAVLGTWGRRPWETSNAAAYWERAVTGRLLMVEAWELDEFLDSTAGRLDGQISF